MLSAAAAAAAVPGASASEVCPAVTIVAARGSDQDPEHGDFLGPARYGERMSNGYEGPNIAGLLHLAEERHPGLFDDAEVLGLDEHTYPAAMNLPPLAKDGERLTSSQTTERLSSVLEEHPLPELAYGTTVGAIDSVVRGARNAPGFLHAREAATGCHPDYIVVGFSQGAVIGTALEQKLGDRVKGAMYMGNPVPWHSPKSVNYCLGGDVICRPTVPNAVDALQTKMEVHASYFETPRVTDAYFADRLAGWVKNSQEVQRAHRVPNQ
ncbi:hypothetical protein HMPREF2559_11525 [Corynebacterium sp. HMSC072G08]|nr:hypothetical protein HMPREF2559_11525 [Corynebacterium sp. HMSC072G08]